MSDLKATVQSAHNGFQVVGHESISYGFKFVDNVFDVKHDHLASIFKPWKRVLLVSDATVSGHYSKHWEAYFAHHGITLTSFIMAGGEKNKTMTTMLSIVDAMNEFGIVRKEPVLVVGGGLCTDVTGYACASYRRTTNFIRVPTTLIGLIDASVSIKVGINHGSLKNRLGAYHAPLMTFLDFNMLRTLPEGQVRNGFAELMKISSCADKRTWELLVQNGEALIESRFGRADGAVPELKAIADEICWRGIKVMLDLESPNLHEIGLDRVIAFGHTLSPTLELSPVIPLRHGHAINIDMSYFITVAWQRGHLTEAERDEYHSLSHRVGLSMDHELFTESMIREGTEAILKTRDNKQRFAVPSPYGTCRFINDATYEELFATLKIHKELIKSKYGSGNGKEAYVDYGDLGMDPEMLRNGSHAAYGMNGKANGAKALNLHAIPAIVAETLQRQVETISASA
ncbi:2-epi-5-epi-valiolone synthase [Trametopsis cervina]|nr:2-epi-5-epi-valiolone synthase [Trametopsis cervina]